MYSHHDSRKSKLYFMLQLMIYFTPFFTNTFLPSSFYNTSLRHMPHAILSTVFSGLVSYTSSQLNNARLQKRTI